MIIGLRTDAPVVELVLAGDEGEVVEAERWEAGRQLADQLLTRLEQLLQRHKVEWPQIKGVVAYSGPGSFTALRIGLTVANTIAYANAAPIIGATGEDWFGTGASRLQRGEGKTQILPEYGAEPNITRPRK